jgi:hypothetical protein
MRLVSDWLGVTACLAAGLMLESLAVRYPEMPHGLGLGLSLLLLSWFMCSGASWRATGIHLAAWDGRSVDWHLLLRNGESFTARLGSRTRVLSSSCVLHWVAAGRSWQVWLTSWDLPPDQLRRAALRLLALKGHGGT